MRYLNIALLMCVASQGSGGDEPIPAAQTGSLFPVLRATADHSTLPLSFLQPEFHDLEKRTYYGNRSFASELAKRGFVVIAIDMFYWGERRMLLPNDPPAWRDRETMSAEQVAAFHRRSSEQTWLVGTGLFEAGITWSGLMFTDDIRTVDYLVSRTEVDPNRIGCCGLSVGGFRAAHLAGLDPRIKAAVVVGWMSTYGDMLQSHLTSIGPMKIIPGLYQSMDLPDVVAMNCPGALMIINGTQDALFPLPGVHAAFDKVAQAYAKAGVPGRFAGVLYDGPHEFNAAMQDQAYAWLERWLEPKQIAPDKEPQP